MKQFNNRGFTLIELLVVIGIIAILAAVVLVAINPARQFGQARNSQRRSDLLTISNSIYQFVAEHNGNLPQGAAGGAAVDIPGVATCIGTGAGCFDLGVAGAFDAGTGLITDPIVPTYLAALPHDPQAAATDGSNDEYEISQDANHRVTLTAINTEIITPDITITR